MTIPARRAVPPPPPPPPEPIIQDLTRPHPKFQSLSRAELYDLVTSMYLDCWSDLEIAHDLSAQFAKPVDVHVVSTIRTEAAIVAEHQPLEVRRRWIYRYQNITVNNLVKEYMFMEKKKRFLQAKRELADEIDALVGSTPPNRLCIAVNDALGRNNIGIEHIRDLQAYALRARKLEAAVRLYASARAMSSLEGLRAVSEEVSRLFTDRCDGDIVRAAQMLAGILGTDHIRYEADDITFLLEYDKLSGDDGNYTLMMKLLRGADVAPRHSSILDQVIAGTARHLSFEDIQNLIELIRTRTILDKDELEQIRKYAERHGKDVETLRELGIRRSMTESIEQAESTALRTLYALANQHLTLVAVSRFLDDGEIRKAAKRDISVNDLQIILDRVNQMAGENQIREFLESIRNSRKYAFPVDRYFDARFTIPVVKRP